jgi:hypothetical protein
MNELTNKKQRLVESLGDVALLEAVEGQPRRIKAIGITADIVNGNQRRYPASVLETAVEEARAHLNETLGQGQLRGRAAQLLGEPEHPSSKSGRANILETVVKWDSISFDGQSVLVEGVILPTSKGRDVIVLLEGGVKIPVSQRAYGNSKIIKEGGRKIEEVTELHITGYDLVVEASDPVAAIIESKQEEHNQMDPEEIRKYIQDHPELFDEAVKAQVAKIEHASAAQIKDLEEKVSQAQAAAEKAQAALDEQERAKAVATAVDEALADLPYSEPANALFADTLRAGQFATVDAVKTFAESLRREFDKRAADDKLAQMGFAPKSKVDVKGPVIETELGIPEYATVSFELTEAIRGVEHRARRDLRKPKTVNEEFTAKYLKKFDEQYRGKLIREMQLFQEAEQSTDLDLPYSVSRAIIAEAFPQLVAIGLFDFAMSDGAQTANLWYETFAGEAGLDNLLVLPEAVVSDEGDWVALANKRITPGSMIVQPQGGGVAFVEGTDYVVDYGDGRFFTITAANGGTIGNATPLDVIYAYTAIRKGEMQPIERAKLTLAHKSITLTADRLATEISREAVVFSRATLGYDATARTLSSLVRQIARKIDQGVIWEALSAALLVPNNSGGTWNSAMDPISEFVQKAGAAKVKVANRYYEPTGMLLSLTRADTIANWDGFTAAGQRPDADLNAEGYIGRMKGLPVFQSTEMSDAYALVANRELVMHRVGQTMQIFGPFPSYDIATGKLIAANQYYAEEFNGTDAPVPEKGSYVAIT